VRVAGTSDIRPGAFPKRPAHDVGRLVSVAIEGNPAFDAGRLVPGSVTVAGVKAVGSRVADVNDDGRADLVVAVREGTWPAGSGCMPARRRSRAGCATAVRSPTRTG
jgi:hypothetical protein